MSEAGKRIKRLREKSGFLQQEIADKMQVSRQVLSNWERGYTETFTFDDIVRLSSMLGVSCDYLITGEEMSIKKQHRELIEMLEQKPDLIKLIQCTKNLDIQSIARVIRYIECVEIV